MSNSRFFYYNLSISAVKVNFDCFKRTQIHFNSNMSKCIFLYFSSAKKRKILPSCFICDKIGATYSQFSEKSDYFLLARTYFLAVIELHNFVSKTSFFPNMPTNSKFKANTLNQFQIFHLRLSGTDRF